MTPTKPKPPIRIIKKSTCQKLSPTARGELTYHVGYSDSAKALHIRVTGNTGGGFFSKQWVSLSDIEHITDGLDGDTFKATIFVPLYQSSSSNNHGFLAAALRAEGILVPSQDHPLSHNLGDIKKFKAEMAKLIKAKTDLHDEVAEEEALKAEKKAAMIERLKNASKAKEAKQ